MFAQSTYELWQSPAEIEVRNSIKVELIPSTTNYIEVIGAEEAIAQFAYEEKEGTLKLYRRDTEKKRKRFLGWLFNDNYGYNSSLNVKLYLTDIELINGIKVRGSSKLEMAYRSEIENLEATISGSSKVILKANIRDVKIGVSGSSRLELEGVFNQMSLGISSSSRVVLSGEADSLKADLSGSSRLDMTGDFTQLTINASSSSKVSVSASSQNIVFNASGSSNAVMNTSFDTLLANLSSSSRLEIKGSGRSAKLECRSASRFYGKDATIRDAVITAASSSRIEINASETLEGSASGDSKVICYGDAQFTIANSSSGRIVYK